MPAAVLGDQLCPLCMAMWTWLFIPHAGHPGLPPLLNARHFLPRPQGL